MRDSKHNQARIDMRRNDERDLVMNLCAQYQTSFIGDSQETLATVRNILRDGELILCPAARIAFKAMLTIEGGITLLKLGLVVDPTQFTKLGWSPFNADLPSDPLVKHDIIDLANRIARAHRQLYAQAEVAAANRRISENDEDADLVVEELHTKVASLGTTRSRPEPLDIAALLADGIPEPDWLIPGWITKQDIALVSGGPTTGKTMLVYDLAIALATGRPWLNMIAPDRPYRVLIFNEEMDDADVVRYIGQLHGSLPENLRVYSMKGIEISSDGGLSEFISLAREFNPDLVIMDSISHFLQYEDENAAPSITAGYRKLFRIRDELNAALALIHHNRKLLENEKPSISSVRGSTAFATQSSTVWIVQLDMENGVQTVRQVKRRSGQLKSLKSIMDEGDTPGSIALEGQMIDLRAEEEASAAKLIRSALARADNETLARKDIADAGKHAKPPHAKRTIDRVLKKLCAAGDISKPTHGHYRLNGNHPENDVAISWQHPQTPYSTSRCDDTEHEYDA